MKLIEREASWKNNSFAEYPRYKGDSRAGKSKLLENLKSIL